MPIELQHLHVGLLSNFARFVFIPDARHQKGA